MPSDSKHDKNQKITNCTTKISAPFTNLSLSSPVKGAKKHIMENTSNNTSSNVHNPGSRNCAIFVRYVNSSELHR